QRARNFDLQVAPRIPDPDAVILDETLEQVDALVQHRVPSVRTGVVERQIAILRPFIEQRLTAIFAVEESSQCSFECPTEEHASVSFFLLPPIDVPVLVSARAAEVLRNLGVAVGAHDAARLLSVGTEDGPMPSQAAAGAKALRLSSVRPFTTAREIFTTPR